MKKYLHTLLADLEEAKKNRPAIPPRPKDEILPIEFEQFHDDDLENLNSESISETPSRKGNIREKMGLTQEQFPPADYWTDEEAALLEHALNDLLKHYNLAADYPKTLPPKMAYTTLVGALEKHAPIMPYGEWHLEFCHYEPSECPFGEAYCSCKNIEIHDFTEGAASSEYEDLPWDIDDDNPNNVPSVYNYCDAWCERCAFNDRCAIARKEDFLNEHASLKLGLWQDISAEFIAAKKWLNMQSNHTKNMIEPLEEERQIFNNEENQVRRDVASVAVIQLAKRYEKLVNSWFEADRIKILLEKLTEKLKAKKAEGKDEKLWEAFSVARWYVFFIFVKFSRAVEGKIDEDDFSDEEGFPKDSEGSSKIALIGAQRSLVAWQQILDILPEERLTVLKMMTLLEAVIFEGEKEFPDAWKFVRPGFDEAGKY